MADYLDTLFNTIGIIGMLLILLAYFMQQMGKWAHSGLLFLYCNVAGAVGLIISLLWSWNLASFMLECAWLMISLLGLYNYYKKRAGGTLS